MKILLLTQYFWPENFRVNELALELNKNGHKVTVLTGRPNYPSGKILNDFTLNKKKYSELNGIKIHRIPLRPRKTGKLNLFLNYLSFVIYGTIYCLFFFRKNKFDIILAPCVSPLTSALPAIAYKYFFRTPIALWIQDLWPEMLEAHGIIRSQKSKFLASWLVQFIYNNCDLLMVQSMGFIQSVSKHNHSSKEMYYLPQWVEDDYIETDNSVVYPDDLYRYKNDFIIMFAGNIGDSQDFDSIINAAVLTKDYNSIKWIIIGSGRGLQKLQKLIHDRNLNDTFILLGQYPKDRMPEFLNAASVLLVSLKAGLPFDLTIPGKLQNYLMMGKPILGMINGEAANIINESRAGIACNASDFQSLADNALILFNMKSDDLLNYSGKYYATLNFDKELIINNLLKKLAQIIQKCE